MLQPAQSADYPTPQQLIVELSFQGLLNSSRRVVSLQIMTLLTFWGTLFCIEGVLNFNVS